MNSLGFKKNQTLLTYGNRNCKCQAVKLIKYKVLHHLNSYNNGHYIQCMHYCILSVVILFALACSQWRFFSVSYKRQATPPRSPEQPLQQHHHIEERSQDAQ